MQKVAAHGRRSGFLLEQAENASEGGEGAECVGRQALENRAGGEYHECSDDGCEPEEGFFHFRMYSNELNFLLCKDT